ncbi:hypothetical protein [Rhizobium sp. NZLR11]|nr:hypothetical protein [Rhizobium sp. NZLR11]MBX5206718.1 hypothetical protein [Rhizobium sp. NZLR11]
MTFLGSLLLALLVGGLFLIAVETFVSWARQYDREPQLDTLDFDKDERQ